MENKNVDEIKTISDKLLYTTKEEWIDFQKSKWVRCDELLSRLNLISESNGNISLHFMIDNLIKELRGEK